MKNLKRFNKQIACALTLIFTFPMVSSCANEVLKDDLETLTLQGFVTKHLTLAEEVVTLLDSEYSFNGHLLTQSINHALSENDLKEVLEDANIEHADEFIELFQQMAANGKRFMDSNSEFQNLPTDKILDEFVKEVDLQLDINLSLTSSLRTSCAEQNVIDANRCLRNYTIAMGAAAIAGAFSFGIGTAISIAAASAIFAVCLQESDDAYYECTNNAT